MNRLTAIGITLLLAAGTCRAAEGDWGYAHINFIKVPLADSWSVISRSQVTFRDDFSEFYFWYADAGLAYNFTPSWRLETAYRHAEWYFADQWHKERRPMINLDWFGKLKGIRLQNMARIEYRDFQWDKEDDWRFRNRIRADFPWKLFGISPFAEEEVFFGHNSGKVEMNWLTAGLSAKPAKHVKLKAGYRWIAIRAGGKWENRNQLVTSLVLLF